MKKLSNLPPKGTSDWMPDEFTIRQYIFQTWRKVCLSFGYREYLTPILESADVYRAKSGDEVGGKELMVFTDRGGRDLAIRPEMTPSVTRMVTRIYEGEPKPIRLFSIANFFRNQKPQRGRNREFWQLNYDMFGADGIIADVEVLQIALEIMLALNPPKKSFTLYVNNRKLIDTIISEYIKVSEDKRTELVQVMDKWEKLSKQELENWLREEDFSDSQIDTLNRFMICRTSDDLIEQFNKIEETDGYKEVSKAVSRLEKLGYKGWVRFQPNIIRGFDYYDGLVFEVFDNHKDNNRSLFGGGRYNGLAKIFGNAEIPAVGAAPGDETLRLFIESWGLEENIRKEMQIETTYVPLLDENLIGSTIRLAQTLRQEGKNVEIGITTQSFSKAFKTADKKGYQYVAILGEEEQRHNKYKLKNLESGEEKEMRLT